MDSQEICDREAHRSANSLSRRSPGRRWIRSLQQANGRANFDLAQSLAAKSDRLTCLFGPTFFCELGGERVAQNRTAKKLQSGPKIVRFCKSSLTCKNTQARNSQVPLIQQEAECYYDDRTHFCQPTKIVLVLVLRSAPSPFPKKCT